MPDVENETQRQQSHQGVLLSQNHVFGGTDGTGKVAKVCVVGDGNENEVASMCVNNVNDTDQSKTYQMLDGRGTSTRVCFVGSQNATPLSGYPGHATGRWEEAETLQQGVSREWMEPVQVEGDVPGTPEPSRMVSSQGPCNGGASSHMEAVGRGHAEGLRSMASERKHGNETSIGEHSVQQTKPMNSIGGGGGGPVSSSSATEGREKGAGASSMVDPAYPPPVIPNLSRGNGADQHVVDPPRSTKPVCAHSLPHPSGQTSDVVMEIDESSDGPEGCGSSPNASPPVQQRSEDNPPPPPPSPVGVTPTHQVLSPPPPGFVVSQPQPMPSPDAGSMHSSDYRSVSPWTVGSNAMVVQQGVQPGIQQGMQPGVHFGHQLGVQPGVHLGVQSGIQGIQPGVQQGMQPGVQAGIQMGVHAGMQMGMQAGVQVGMQPGVQVGMPHGVQQGMQPVVQPGMQPGVQVGVHPAMQPGVQLGVQPMGQRSIPGWFIPAPGQSMIGGNQFNMRNPGASGVPNTAGFQPRPPQSSPGQSLIQNAVHRPVGQHLHHPPTLTPGAPRPQLGNGYNNWARVQQPMGTAALPVQGAHLQTAQLQPHSTMHMPGQRLLVETGRPMMSPGVFGGAFPNQPVRHPQVLQSVTNLRPGMVPGGNPPGVISPQTLQPVQHTLQTSPMYSAVPQGGMVVGRPIPGVGSPQPPHVPVRYPFQAPPPRQTPQQCPVQPQHPAQRPQMPGPPVLRPPPRPVVHVPPHPSHGGIGMPHVSGGRAVTAPAPAPARPLVLLPQAGPRSPHVQPGAPVMMTTSSAPTHGPHHFPQHQHPMSITREAVQTVPVSLSPQATQIPGVLLVSSGTGSQSQGLQSVGGCVPVSLGVPPPPPLQCSLKPPPPPPPPQPSLKPLAGPRNEASMTTQVIERPLAQHANVSLSGTSIAQPGAAHSPRVQTAMVSTPQAPQTRPVSRDPRLSQNNSAAGIDLKTDQSRRTPSAPHASTVRDEAMDAAKQTVQPSLQAFPQELPKSSSIPPAMCVIMEARAKEIGGAGNAQVAGDEILSNVGQRTDVPVSLKGPSQDGQQTLAETDSMQERTPEKGNTGIQPPGLTDSGPTPASPVPESTPTLMDSTPQQEYMVRDMETNNDTGATPAETMPASAVEQGGGALGMTDMEDVSMDGIPGLGSTVAESPIEQKVPAVISHPDSHREEPVVKPEPEVEQDPEQAAERGPDREPVRGPDQDPVCEPQLEPTTSRARNSEGELMVSENDENAHCSPSLRSDVPRSPTPSMNLGEEEEEGATERQVESPPRELLASPSGTSPMEIIDSPAGGIVWGGVAEEPPLIEERAPPSPPPVLDVMEEEFSRQQIGDSCSLANVPNSPLSEGLGIDANADMMMYELNVENPLEGSIPVGVLEDDREADMPRMETRMCIIGRPTVNRPRARCHKLTSLDLRQDGTMICSVDLSVGATFICCLEDDDQPLSKKNVGEVLLNAREMVSVPVVSGCQEEVDRNEAHVGGDGDGRGAFADLVDVRVTWDGPELPEKPAPCPMIELHRELHREPPRGSIPAHAVVAPTPAGDFTAQDECEQTSLTSGPVQDTLPRENGTPTPQSAIGDCESAPECSEPWGIGNSNGNANGLLPHSEMDLDGGDDEQRVSQASNEQETDNDGDDKLEEVQGAALGAMSMDMVGTPKPEAMPLPAAKVETVPPLTGIKRDSPDNACGGLVRIPVEEGTLAEVLPKRPKLIHNAMHGYDSSFVCSVRQSGNQQLDSVVLSTPDLQGAGPTVGSVVGFDYADSATLCWVGTERRASENDNNDMENLLGIGNLRLVPVVQDEVSRRTDTL